MKKPARATEVVARNRAAKKECIFAKHLTSGVFGLVAMAIISLGAYSSSDAANKDELGTGTHGQASAVTTKTANPGGKTVLRAQTAVNQVPNNLTPGAKAASDRYEGLNTGILCQEQAKQIC